MTGQAMPLPVAERAAVLDAIAANGRLQGSLRQEAAALRFEFHG